MELQVNSEGWENKRKKHKKNKKKATDSENVNEDELPNVLESEQHVQNLKKTEHGDFKGNESETRKKKRKKKHKSDSEGAELIAETGNTREKDEHFSKDNEDVVNTNTIKKNKKRKHNSDKGEGKIDKTDEENENETKKKKGKKGHKTDTDSNDLVVGLNSGGEEHEDVANTDKIKKKKKRKHRDEKIDNDIGEPEKRNKHEMDFKNEIENSVLVQGDSRKKEKKKKKKENDVSQNGDVVKVETEEECVLTLKKKKKCKKREGDSDCQGNKNDSLQIEEVQENMNVADKKKKKKKSKNVNENELDIDAKDSKIAVGRKKAKKRKHRDTDQEGSRKEKFTKEENDCEPNSLHDDINQSKKVKRSETIFVDGTDTVGNKKRKKSKKTKIENAEDNNPPAEKDSNEENVGDKNGSDIPCGTEDKISKKQKKRKDKKRESENPDGDNNDKVSITVDQSKEISVEKVEHNSSIVGEEQKYSKVNAGQWSSAEFDSADRQQKFLRLLGGFKKSSENGGTGCQKLGAPGAGVFKWSKAVNRTSANQALDKTEESKLNTQLESQFNKALELRLSGGVGMGLGYSEPPGAKKKFYIDVNKSTSKKFGDSD